MLWAETKGCNCAEMEAFKTLLSLENSSDRYSGRLNINFGFVGHVSDRPLVEGDTLAEELDSDEGEQAAVSDILEKIKERS